MRCSARSPRWATATRRCAPAATTHAGSTAPTRPGREWVERWHATSTLTPRVRAHHPQPAGQGRPVAGRRAPRDHRARPVDPGDLRRLGRRGGPDDASATTSSARDGLGDRAGDPIAPRTKAAHPHRRPRRSSATARNGSGSPAGSTRHRALATPRSVAALIGTDPRVIADDVWAKLLWAGLNLHAADLPGRLRRHLLPDRAGPRGHPDLAVLRPAQRRDRPAAGRVHPLAARRHAHRRRLPRGPRRATPSACSTCPSHKTGTAFTKPVDPIARPGHRRLAGRCGPTQPQRARPQDRRAASTCCSPSAPSRSPRTTSTTPIIPTLCAQGRRPDRRRPRQHHQPPGPLHHRQPALQRQGADDAVRAAGLARPPHRRQPPSTTRRSPRTR